MNDKLVSVVIVGARGRMGTALLRAAAGSDDIAVVGAVDRSGGPLRDTATFPGLREEALMLTDELRPPRGSVVVDFSLPEATDANVTRCLEAGVPLVLGTTGLSETTRALLVRAAKDIPIVHAPNFSVGVTLLTRLAAIAARALGEGWDAEIIEVHHRHKRDAPSGTALRIGQAVAEARGQAFEQVAVLQRESNGNARASEQIGIVAVRGGDSVGEHTLALFGEGERLELCHRATDRAIFARGALRAANWVSTRPPGLYDMADVLGLSGND